MRALIIKNNILNHKTFFTRKYLLADPFQNKSELIVGFYMNKDGEIHVRYKLCGAKTRMPYALSNLQCKGLKPLEGIGTILQERDFENLSRNPEKYVSIMLEEIYESKNPWNEFESELKDWLSTGVEKLVERIK